MWTIKDSCILVFLKAKKKAFYGPLVSTKDGPGRRDAQPLVGPLKCFSGQLVGPLLFFLKVPPHPPVRSYANEHFAFIFVELDL